MTINPAADLQAFYALWLGAKATCALPATLVRAAEVSAVVTVAAGDLAVAALDTTAAVPASRDAPPMQLIATAVLDPAR